ncbi:MAG: RusA family crossover junction endodeoxyribonuclease [Lachnospiraceae bacterium]|nr:RusA family crossover junction endodeoxyribonuclease [Lachnospiraceae bacterium]
MKLCFCVPLPPSINHAYFYKGGKKIKTKTTRDYETIVKKIAIDLLEDNNAEMFPDKTKLVMDMTYYFPDHIKRDTHNTFKIPLDAMEKILYKDDYWVLPRIKDFIVEKGRREVYIELYIK